MPDYLARPEMRFLTAAVVEDGKLALSIDIGDDQVMHGVFALQDILRLPSREPVNGAEPTLPGMPVPLSVTLRTRCDGALTETRDGWVSLGEAARAVLDGLERNARAQQRASLPSRPSWIANYPPDVETVSKTRRNIEVDEITDENFTGGLSSEEYLDRLRNGRRGS